MWVAILLFPESGIKAKGGPAKINSEGFIGDPSWKKDQSLSAYRLMALKNFPATRYHLVPRFATLHISMANKIDLRHLKQGADAWNAWRHRHRPSLNNPTTRKLRAIYPIPLDELSRLHLRYSRHAIDLSGADLSGVNLEGADLSNADLSGSDLSGSTLTHAVFVNSSLCSAALTKCDLTCADLTGTDLTDADLQGANLTAATIRAALLSGANFKASGFRLTVLANVDLSEARGLEEVRHHGPSIIGIDVIYRSRGGIPAIFLRGAGVPDSLIQNAKALVEATAPIQFYSCFISYSHANKIFARRLCRELEDRGIRCWLDEHQLLPGDDMYHAVDQGIRIWDKLLLCCSAESLKSWCVDHEIGTGERTTTLKTGGQQSACFDSAQS